MIDVASPTPLHLLAVDHRNSLLTRMPGVADAPASDRPGLVRGAKEIVLDGLLLALEQGVPAAPAGLLVDTEFGSAVARRARAHQLHLALPLEKSGQRELVVESISGIPALVEQHDPTFLKVLVRYNPGGDAAMNARQRRTLQRVVATVEETGRLLMLELLLPAEPAQLEAVAGDARRYDDELRPELTVRALAELRGDGILPAVWKVEGLSWRADCERVVAAATDDGRNSAVCVVLGRGADRERVEEWLRVASSVAGFAGFAVGRTIWWDSIEKYLAGAIDRDAATAEIAATYRRVVDVHAGAQV
ncbi:MAG: 2-deoxy-5-keto-D-gluconate 6-phosphate aldolase domain-containing protein [Candidatus Dormibacteria bacterium]